VGSRSPDGWDQIPYRPGVWVLHQPPWSFGKTGAPCVKVPGSSRVPTLEFWVRFPNERNQGKQAHPVLKYRVPHGSHGWDQTLLCVMSRLIHRPRLVVSHSTCPPLSSPPHANSFVIGPAVIKHTLPSNKSGALTPETGLPLNNVRARGQTDPSTQHKRDGVPPRKEMKAVAMGSLVNPELWKRRIGPGLLSELNLGRP